MTHEQRLKALNEAGEKLDAERETGSMTDEAWRATLSAGLKWRDQAANARATLALAAEIIEAAMGVKGADKQPYEEWKDKMDTLDALLAKWKENTDAK